MSRYNNRPDLRNSGHKKKLTFSYMALIVVAILILPFFIDSLRVQISGGLKLIFGQFGNYCLIIGMVFVLIGLIGLFTKSRNWTKSIIVGIILLWIGCWITGSIFEIFGFTFGGPDTGAGNGFV